MMNTMSNNKLNIDELEMVNGGGFWDALVNPIRKVTELIVDGAKAGPFFEEVGIALLEYAEYLYPVSFSPYYQEQYRTQLHI